MFVSASCASPCRYLDLSENYLTGVVPSTVVEAFGNDPFHENCLVEGVGDEMEEDLQIKEQRELCDNPNVEVAALLALWYSTGGSLSLTAGCTAASRSPASFSSPQSSELAGKQRVRRAARYAVVSDVPRVSGVVLSPFFDAPV